MKTLEIFQIVPYKTDFMQCHGNSYLKIYIAADKDETKEFLGQ